MHLIVVGLSHKTARIEQREKAALTEPATRALIRDLLAEPEISEAAAFSTCNRTEVYLVSDDSAAGEQAATRALVEHSLIALPELECARYSLRDDRAAAHLFRVAASLDSMVIGESEIQGQVRAAFELAQEEDAVGPVLDRRFRHALGVGKRVRRETTIGKGAVWVSSVAVELAREAVADLPRRRALLIGAGGVAESTAQALVDQGVRELVVVNRTASTARALAARMGGTGVGFDQLDQELAATDIVISSTDAPHTIVRRDHIEAVMARRAGRPMILIDIAVPRDLDADIAEVAGVSLHDIDDLERVVEANMNGRLREAERAEIVVAAETRRFAEWRRGLAVVPTIGSLREMAEEIRAGEVAKASGQWDTLSDADRERVDLLTKAIVNKLLHEPTVRARAAAAEGDGIQHLDSVRHLFALEARAPGRRPASGGGDRRWRSPSPSRSRRGCAPLGMRSASCRL